MDTIGLFSKARAFVRFSKRGRGDAPSLPTSFMLFENCPIVLKESAEADRGVLKKKLF